MPGRAHHYATVTLTNATESANNTETVVATLTPVSLEFPGQTVRLMGMVNATTGAGTTAATLRIRRTGLTGTLVSGADAMNQSVAATKGVQVEVFCDDTPGDIQGATYVLTYQGTGDTAVATFNAVRLEAWVE